jgi:hypothetical protein
MRKYLLASAALLGLGGAADAGGLSIIELKDHCIAATNTNHLSEMQRACGAFAVEAAKSNDPAIKLAGQKIEAMLHAAANEPEDNPVLTGIPNYWETHNELSDKIIPKIIADAYQCRLDAARSTIGLRLQSLRLKQ